jgi:hypothetical protein
MVFLWNPEQNYILNQLNKETPPLIGHLSYLALSTSEGRSISSIRAAANN